jgi:hypothetical protein
MVMARKKVHGNTKKVDEKLIYALAKKWCPTEEIADILCISPDTIERRFMHILKKARAEGKESLRTAQWKSALEGGNVAMQIWLGKQKLGQKEPAKEEVAEAVVEEIKFTVHPSMVPDAPRNQV